MSRAPAAMRCFLLRPEGITELPALPEAAPVEGFVWLALERSAFEQRLPALQQTLLQWGVMPLVDLHVSDLLNPQLPSQFDLTSGYDLMVFRRLASSLAGEGSEAPPEGHPQAPAAPPRAAAVVQAMREALAAVDTSPVGFAVYDRLLLTVHPADCTVRDFFAQRMTAVAGAPLPPSARGGAPGGEARHDHRGASRLPTSPSELMLRMLNHMVDSYLALRRLLGARLAALQARLLDPRAAFHDWQVLLDARNALQLLADTSEDQHAAVQEWIDALAEWPPAEGKAQQRERELLRVRARDVLEHIERVLDHVRRLEQSAETAVQLHFSALGHRTNDIMRTLTVLTALFLPLNLITGFFGMNFDGLPLIHSQTGVWIAGGMMLVIALALGGFFWRRRYIER